MSVEDWANRVSRLQEDMTKSGLDGCLVTQNVGIYYFTGSMQTGFLFIPSSGEPVYFVRRSLSRAQAESRVRTVELGSLRLFGSQLAEHFPALFAEARKPVIGTDSDVLPAQLYIKLTEAVPAAVWTDASSLLRRVRSIKSSYEIGRIEEAAEIAAAALEYGLSLLAEGMTEIELMAHLEHAMRQRGHIGIMRVRGYNQEMPTGMVAAGEAAAEPTYFVGPAGGRGLTPASPQSASRRPFGRGEPILIDIGCCIDGYMIDQTRTAVIGVLPPALRAAYDAAEAILRRTESLLRPGAIPERIYENSLAMAAEAGLSEHFMGYGRDQVKFLGHGIGLEIDEWPVLARGFRDPLEPGMVLAVEPKFTFPGLGVVGIENTYLVTESGCRALTRSPERLFEIGI